MTFAFSLRKNYPKLSLSKIPVIVYLLQLHFLFVPKGFNTQEPAFRRGSLATQTGCLGG
jgi:hypothetical protein